MAAAPENEIKRTEIELKLEEPYDLQSASRKMSGSELVDALIVARPWVKANGYWKLTFIGILARGKLGVEELDRLAPHLDTTISDEFWHGALFEMARNRNDWAHHRTVAWFLARCDVKNVRNYHNLLVAALRNPTSFQPAKLIALSLIECACDGELHFAARHDLMQDFNRNMVGRRIFIGGEEVTRALPFVFSLGLEYCAEEHMVQLLLQHNLMIGEGTKWIVDATYELSFPICFHDRFLTPLLVSLADASNIDGIIAKLRAFEEVNEWLNVGRIRSQYRESVVVLLEEKKQALAAVAK